VTLTCHKKYNGGFFNEFMIIVELTIVHVIRNVEDEKRFSTLIFMKSKLWNQLVRHLNVAICMFAHDFDMKETFFLVSYYTLKQWKQG
jgi:hypothetical protein